MPLSGTANSGLTKVLRPIGKGGTGEAGMARDTRLDRNAALKVPRQDFTERFEGEALTVTALNHPKSCQLTTSVRITWAWNTPRGDNRHLFAGLCRTL